MQQSVKEDLEQKSKMKEILRKKQEMEKEEMAQLFKYNNDRILQREIEYKQRYIKFNADERKKEQVYRNSMNIESNGSKRAALSRSFEEAANPNSGQGILNKLHNQDQTL